ncbi:hypothetical protein WDW86_01475 [Bdellovibrionota bacterium FG-2]
MKFRGILQILFLVGFVLLLLRFFPLVVRLGDAAALGVRGVVEFWWVVLLLALGGWLIWVLRKRNSG